MPYYQIRCILFNYKKSNHCHGKIQLLSHHVLVQVFLKPGKKILYRRDKYFLQLIWDKVDFTCWPTFYLIYAQTSQCVFCFQSFLQPINQGIIVGFEIKLPNHVWVMKSSKEIRYNNIMNE